MFQSLARFLPSPELTLLSSDYHAAQQLGGNVEHGLEREEGVSYNPRLARVLSIMATDLGITDITSLRAALYAAIFDSGLGAERSAATCDMNVIPPELQDLVAQARNRDTIDGTGCSIRGVIALDAVRHLHQTSWALSERESILTRIEGSIVSNLRGSAPEILVQKLQSAIDLQRRRLAADQIKA